MADHHCFVVVGASFAGLGVTHYIVKHTIPKLKKANEGGKYKVILILATDRFFYKIAAPRTIASPDKISVSELFYPLTDYFKAYQADHFELVIGKAISVNESEKSVTVKQNDAAQTSIFYNSLICATGSRFASPLWALHDSPQQSIDEFKAFHEKLSKAKTILIVGGGSVGVETAGEIATAYPDKKIILISGFTQLLTRLTGKSGSKVGKSAESFLSNMGVTTIHNVQVGSTKTIDSQIVVKFKNDRREMTADIYIDATGGVRNSDWLSCSWLTFSSQVSVDEFTLRHTVVPNVYAIGDIASYSHLSVLDTHAVRPLASSILEDLSPAPKPKRIPFKQTKKPTQLVPLGQKVGVGIIFGWRVPSLVVWGIKGRKYFVDKAEGTPSGTDYDKEQRRNTLELHYHRVRHYIPL